MLYVFLELMPSVRFMIFLVEKYHIPCRGHYFQNSIYKNKLAYWGKKRPSEILMEPKLAMLSYTNWIEKQISMANKFKNPRVVTDIPLHCIPLYPSPSYYFNSLVEFQQPETVPASNPHDIEDSDVPRRISKELTSLWKWSI